MERHMEGLCQGGSAAFEMFAAALSEPEEPGQAFAVALLCMRLEARAPKEALEAALGAPVPAGHRLALIDALQFATDPVSEEWLARFLRTGGSGARRAALAVAALRPGLLDAATALTQHADPLVALEATRTLLAAGRRVPVPPLHAHLNSPQPEVVALALELALRSAGAAPGAEACRAVAMDADAGVLTAAMNLLAISGQGGEVAHLRQVVEARPELAAAAWLALGLTGDVAALEILRARLDAPWELPDQLDELLALAAAGRLLTGRAALPAFNPHDFEPAELEVFREEARNGWAGFEKTAAKTRRYRRGEPLSAPALARDLVGPGHPRRDLCHLQLALLYDLHLPFDARAPFAAQRAAARAIAASASR